MTKEVSQLIKDIVLDMNCTVFGVYDSVNLRTNICDTKWARIGKTVTNSTGDEYRIIDMIVDEWIQVTPITPNAPILEDLINLPSPFWITGTKIATNREWTISGKNVTEKTPIIWLLQTLRITKYGRENTLDFNTDVRLFFLDETNVLNYYTEDHLDLVVFPMERLVKEFLDTITRTRQYKTIEDYEIITFSRFGVEQNEGMFKNILDANLSGVELRIGLEKYKENCKC